MSTVSIPGRIYGDYRTNIDTETGKTEDGKVAFLSFSVGEYNFRKKCVNFFDVVVFGKTAELVIKFYANERSVVVEGGLDVERFKTKDGRDVKKIQIIGHRVVFLTDGNTGLDPKDPRGEKKEKAPLDNGGSMMGEPVSEGDRDDDDLPF